MELQVDRDSGVPVGTQLAWRLRAAIDRGELGPGDRLPSLRDAAAAAGLNVNTVRAAYAKLESAGVVATEQGRGTFVVVSPVAVEDDGGSARRRDLRGEIARLEAELVSLPLIPRDAATSGARSGGNTAADGRTHGGTARLLSVEELETVRDLLAERVDELAAARTAIVARLQGERRAALETSPTAHRAPARRSSSSLAGARIRWT